MLFFLIGFVSALAGVGGGVFFVPLLIYYGFEPHVAVGTSSIAVAITTTVGGLGYYRAGLFDKRITLKAALSAYPGVILGVFLSVSIPEIIKPAIGLMLFLSGYRAFKSFSVPERLQAPSFFITGLLVGLLGIGGGAILTPVIVSTSGYDLVHSLGIAYTTMPLLTIVAAVLHILYGEPDIIRGIKIGLLASLGSYSGAKFVSKYRRRVRIRHLIGVIMFLVGGYMIASRIFR